MKIILPFEFHQNLSLFMRRSGYHEFNDYNTGKTSYIKRLGEVFYPRYHVYIEQDRDNRVSINLHLDQKKPSYAGAHAHSAEYDGPVVEREAQRLEGLIKNQMDNQLQVNNTEEDKKGFWQKLFG
ncbi:MAG: hypothetical protein WCX71_00140 [Candidatus Buchananbacteria bacterium]